MVHMPFSMLLDTAAALTPRREHYYQQITMCSLYCRRSTYWQLQGLAWRRASPDGHACRSQDFICPFSTHKKCTSDVLQIMNMLCPDAM